MEAEESEDFLFDEQGDLADKIFPSRDGQINLKGLPQDEEPKSSFMSNENEIEEVSSEEFDKPERGEDSLGLLTSDSEADRLPYRLFLDDKAKLDPQKLPDWYTARMHGFNSTSEMREYFPNDDYLENYLREIAPKI